MDNKLIIGCMRFAEFNSEDMNHVIHYALDLGLNHFDHADIYGQGASEDVFGNAIKNDASISRDKIIIQTKCGIVSNVKYPHYDLSKEHIIESVNNSLKRLQTEYIDTLLLHRPDALVEPEEVAQAFDTLYSQGKVRQFGVSNHKPIQIELLKKCVKQTIVANQLQFSLPVSNMVANGMEVNMTTDGATNRDEDVLDYCRLNDITIQAWSPLQMPNWQGCFLGNEKYKELNKVLNELAETYKTTPASIAYAWILRHPAKMQVVTGTTKENRIKEAYDAVKIALTREDWYRLYLSAGHILP